jgi:hypothetical protein
MTKHLISEAAGISTYLAVSELESPTHRGWKHIKITTTYDYSRDPDYEQTKLDLCMDPVSFDNLKSIVNIL